MCVCTTGCSLTDLASTDVVRQWADRGSVNTLSLPSGVVCQSRTAAESQAVYICDNENGAETRVCQNYWIWNGSIPQCSANLERQNGKCIFACVYIIAQEPAIHNVRAVLEFLSLVSFKRRHRFYDGMKRIKDKLVVSGNQMHGTELSC